MGADQAGQTSARVLADSINSAGDRVTTVVATFARSGLAELNTHRRFSRSSSSSRAIPVERLLASVMNEPFIPRRFSINRKGMNASEFLFPGLAGWDDAKAWWLRSRDLAVEQAQEGVRLGLHKQDVNRLLEPFLLHTAVITSTEWENFFGQRCALDDDGHPLAYLPVYDVAVAIRDALSVSVPVERAEGGEGAWHTPLAGLPQDAGLSADELRRVAVARCARVSYFDIDGRKDIEEAAKSPEADMALFERLLKPSNSSAPHLSPFEHVAVAAPGRVWANFDGWRQMRFDVEQKMGGWKR